MFDIVHIENPFGFVVESLMDIYVSLETFMSSVFYILGVTVDIPLMIDGQIQVFNFSMMDLLFGLGFVAAFYFLMLKITISLIP